MLEVTLTAVWFAIVATAAWATLRLIRRYPPEARAREQLVHTAAELERVFADALAEVEGTERVGAPPAEVYVSAVAGRYPALTQVRLAEAMSLGPHIARDVGQLRAVLLDCDRRSGGLHTSASLLPSLTAGHHAASRVLAALDVDGQGRAAVADRMLVSVCAAPPTDETLLH